MEQIIESFEDVVLPVGGGVASFAMLGIVWSMYSDIVSNMLNSIFFR